MEISKDEMCASGEPRLNDREPKMQLDPPAPRVSAAILRKDVSIRFQTSSVSFSPATMHINRLGRKE